MKPPNLLKYFNRHPGISALTNSIATKDGHLHLQGLIGSSSSLVAASVFKQAVKQQHLIILPDKEQAAYFYNDLENLFGETETDYNKKRILFYPTSYKRPYEPENPDRAYQLSRTEVLKRTISGDRKTLVVSYPEALAEKVITKQYLSKNTMKLKVGEEVSLDFVGDLLAELEAISHSLSDFTDPWGAEYEYTASSQATFYLWSTGGSIDGNRETFIGNPEP